MNLAAFLKVFFATTLLLVAATAALLLSTGPDFPAPHLSNSYSFNVKAAWLRRALAARRCQVLVIGSSMSLNGLDARQFARPGEQVINLASWGLDPEDNLRFLRLILPLCHPRRIVMATYHGDFAAQASADKAIHWAVLNDFLRGGSMLHAYLADFDPDDLIQQSLAVDDRRSAARYESLDFDATGSVALACGAAFPRSAERWNGDLGDTLGPPRPAALAAIAMIARMAGAVGADFTVAVMPLRPRAQQGLAPAARAALWSAVAARLAAAGGHFILPAGNASFTDGDFVDYAHLNGCGARRWTRLVTGQTAN